jgi:hypothetical protein
MSLLRARRLFVVERRRGDRLAEAHSGRGDDYRFRLPALVLTVLHPPGGVWWHGRHCVILAVNAPVEHGYGPLLRAPNRHYGGVVRRAVLRRFPKHPVSEAKLASARPSVCSHV